MAVQSEVAKLTEIGRVARALSSTWNESVVVPEFPSAADAPPIVIDGAPWTWKVETFVVDAVAVLIVTFTFRGLPTAVAGTTNESRAVPALKDSACAISRP